MSRVRVAERQPMQHPLVWAVAFVIGSAIAGPVVLSPPWWHEFRRQQQLGFAIGAVTWGLALLLVMAYF
jgi:hypothetical protein